MKKEFNKAELSKINKQVAEMEDAFNAIQQPRTDYELEKFVVKAHDTKPRQWAQCVLELQIKYDDIRRAMLHREKMQLEIEMLNEKNDKISSIDAKLKAIDIEQQDRAMLGALREFKALYAIYKSFPRQYSRDELNADEVNYWHARLTRQAKADEQAHGRIRQGNMDALRMINTEDLPKPSSKSASKPEMSVVDAVERRFLETSNENQKILIAMATEKKLEDVPEQFKVSIPSGWQVKLYNCHGRNIDDAYKDIFWTAINDNARLLLTVEDDTFPEMDVLFKLMEHWRSGKEVVGAWYPKRTKVREGAPIIFDGFERRHLPDDGEVHEVWTIPFGCTLFDVGIFNRIPQPWVVTTSIMTQDSFFSQRARDVGIKLFVDTAIKCKHIDRTTGEVFA